MTRPTKSSRLSAVAMVVFGLADGALAADWIRAGIDIDQPIWGLRDGLQLPALPTLPFGLRFAQAMTFHSVAGVADAVAALSERPSRAAFHAGYDVPLHSSGAASQQL